MNYLIRSVAQLNAYCVYTYIHTYIYKKYNSSYYGNTVEMINYIESGSFSVCSTCEIFL